MHHLGCLEAHPGHRRRRRMLPDHHCLSMDAPHLPHSLVDLSMRHHEGLGIRSVARSEATAVSRMDTKTEEEETTQTAGSGSRKWKGATSAFGLGLRVYLTAFALTTSCRRFHAMSAATTSSFVGMATMPSKPTQTQTRQITMLGSRFSSVS
jgi:hypothetical protein